VALAGDNIHPNRDVVEIVLSKVVMGDGVVERTVVLLRLDGMVVASYSLHDWDPNFRVCSLLRGLWDEDGDREMVSDGEVNGNGRGKTFGRRELLFSLRQRAGDVLLVTRGR
jgi:hypothetical protein